MRIHRPTTQEVWKRAIDARHIKKPGGHARRGRERKWARCKTYFKKMKGHPHKKRQEHEIYPVEIIWSFIGGLLGIGALSLINRYILGNENQLLLMGTFGASAMLLFGAPQVPFSQPRNVIGGHFFSALVGITVCQLVGAESAWAAPLAVSVAIAVMHATCTLHPPGGGTALLMVAGSPEMLALGYKALLFPVLTGAITLVAVALLVNNISRARSYPSDWW